MNHSLHFRINPHHPRIKIRVIPYQDLRIPSTRHKNRIHPTPNRCHEDLADLQADQKRKRHDDGGEFAALVVGRVGKLEVEEGEEGAEVGDEGGAHGQNGANEAVVDKGVNAAVLHHARRMLAIEKSSREGGD